MIDVAVVDYGMGNLRSVAKALEHVAPERTVVVTADPADIRAARRVVFPGQGAMPDCMREMESRGLRAPLVEAAQTKPFLGLCIGLQMLFETSEEGGVQGLGILPGKVVRFPADRMVGGRGEKLKVPHMGWNQVHAQRACPLFEGIADGSDWYFVHSYFVDPSDRQLAATTTTYGISFVSSVWRDNIVACQFHPEKSQTVGLRLIKNFGGWKA